MSLLTASISSPLPEELGSIRGKTARVNGRNALIDIHSPVSLQAKTHVIDVIADFENAGSTCTVSDQEQAIIDQLPFPKADD